MKLETGSDMVKLLPKMNTTMDVYKNRIGSQHFWRSRSWKNAFGCVGLSGNACDLSEEIRSLGLVHNTVKPLSIPKETDIAKLWSKKRSVPFKSLFLLPAKLHLEEIS